MGSAGLLDLHMSVLEAMDGLARKEEAFRLSETVHLLLQRCSIMSNTFRADVVNYMKHMLERLASLRCGCPSSGHLRLQAQQLNSVPLIVTVGSLDTCCVHVQSRPLGFAAGLAQLHKSVSAATITISN